jgi:UDP:flavonoid glycosyltransferase YjiC (YdhE family)
MRALVAAMPFAGHVQPMAAVAAELSRRGHDVVAYTGRAYGQRFATSTSRTSRRRSRR